MLLDPTRRYNLTMFPVYMDNNSIYCLSTNMENRILECWIGIIYYWSNK